MHELAIDVDVVSPMRQDEQREEDEESRQGLLESINL